MSASQRTCCAAFNLFWSARFVVGLSRSACISTSLASFSLHCMALGGSANTVQTDGPDVTLPLWHCWHISSFYSLYFFSSHRWRSVPSMPVRSSSTNAPIVRPTAIYSFRRRPCVSGCNCQLPTFWTRRCTLWIMLLYTWTIAWNNVVIVPRYVYTFTKLRAVKT